MAHIPQTVPAASPNILPACRSLKTKITLSVLIIFVVSLWVLEFQVSRIMERDLEAILGSQQLSTATFVAGAIEDEVRDRLAALQAIADQITPARLGNVPVLQAALEQRPILMLMFNAGVFVTRNDGIVIADVSVQGNRRGLNVMDRDYILTTLKEGKPSVGRPVVGKNLQTPTISMAVPIRDPQGRVIGALVGVTDLNRPNMLDRLAGTGYGQNGGYVLVAARDRRVVTATDKTRIMETLPAPGINPVIDHYIAGGEGVGLSINPLGVEVLTAARQIPLAGWYIVVSLPTAEAFAPMQNLHRQMFEQALLLSLLIAALIWWLMHRQMSPMVRAAAAVEMMTRNQQFAEPVPIESRDEIGVLVGSFNRLLGMFRQREADLRISEYRWKFAIEGSGDGIWDWKIDEGSVFLSARWKTMLGYAEDEIGSGLDEWEKRLHPDDKTIAMAALADYVTGKTMNYSSEHRLQCKDGSYKWILDRGMVVERDEAGIPLRMIGTHSDISPRIRLTQELTIFKRAVDSAGSMVMITDRDWHLIYVNPAFTKITGYGANEVLGRNPTFLGSPKFNPTNTDELGQFLSAGQTWSGTFCNERKDGTLLWERATISPILDDTGGIAYFVAVKDDITEELRLKEELALHRLNLEALVVQRTEELEREKALFEDLINTQPFGMIRVYTGLSAASKKDMPPIRVDVVSSGLRKMLGSSQPDLRENPAAIIDHIHPEDRAQLTEKCNEAIEGKSNLAWEGRMLIGGGYHRVRIDASPRIIGNEIAWTAVLQDIELRMRQSDLLYRSVIEASPDAFIAIDGDDRILEWSPRAEHMFGHTAQAVKGQSLSEIIIPPGYAANHVNSLRELVAGGGDNFVSKRRRLTARKHGGAEFPIELQTMSLKIDGQWRFSSFIRDITEEIHAEQQMVQAQKLEAIGHLTSGLAHDFNNILGIILGNLDLLRQEITTGELHEMIQSALIAAKRGAEVTKSLLAIARRRNLKPSIMDVGQLLKELKPLLIQTLSKRIAVKISASPEHTRVMMDAGAFNNALLNIVINARDAMPEGGTLLAYTYPMLLAPDHAELPGLVPGHYLVVGVDDTGVGMPPDVVRQAFDPFFTTKSRDKGTGLGLSMVFGFARQTGGTARIVSKPGMGTSVQMVLPLMPDAEDAPQGQNDPSAAECPPEPGNRRILVVDDETPLLDIMARWLRKLGCEVLTAANAEAAVALLNQERFDLMLTDVIMPGEMDGLALARHAAARFPETCILLASGYPENISNEDRARWVLLEKPLDQHTLSNAVANALGQRNRPEKGTS